MYIKNKQISRYWAVKRVSRISYLCTSYLKFVFKICFSDFSLTIVRKNWILIINSINYIFEIVFVCHCLWSKLYIRIRANYVSSKLHAQWICSIIVLAWKFKVHKLSLFDRLHLAEAYVYVIFSANFYKWSKTFTHIDQKFRYSEL